MKKFLCFFFALIAIIKANAQDENSSINLITVERISEKTDNGQGVISENRFEGSYWGLNGKFFTGIEYNKIGKKTFGIAGGYAHPAYEDELIGWAIGAKIDVVPNLDPQKSKQLLVGGMALVHLNKDDEYEGTATLSYTTKLRNFSGEYNQGRLLLTLEVQKKLGNTFGIGINGEYRSTNWTEVYIADPNVQFNGYKSSDGRLHVGIFGSVKFGPFQAFVGPTFQRTMNSWQQNNINMGQKQFYNSNFYTGLRIGATVKF